MILVFKVYFCQVYVLREIVHAIIILEDTNVIDIWGDQSAFQDWLRRSGLSNGSRRAVFRLQVRFRLQSVGVEEQEGSREISNIVVGSAASISTPEV
ncbi:hypothetical protein SRHO_G00043460 [Serrasalmus rhombeus]